MKWDLIRVVGLSITRESSLARKILIVFFREDIMAVSKEWFMKFSDVKKVKITPFNPKIKTIIEEFEQNLSQILNKNIEIEHRGASALGISGKGEVDIYVRVTPKQFKPALEKLTKKYGAPGSLEKDRARFNQIYKEIEFEIMLVHKDSPHEIEGKLFFNYLKTHPRALKEYERMKEKYAKISRREYFIQKDKFIRKILELAKKRVSKFMTTDF